jgi:hypothetical protein
MIGQDMISSLLARKYLFGNALAAYQFALVIHFLTINENFFFKESVAKRKNMVKSRKMSCYNWARDDWFLSLHLA